MSTVRYLIRRSIDAESKSKGFYERLAELFSHEQRISEFWTDLAGDERDHVKWLQDAERALPEESLDQVLEPELEKILADLEAFLRSYGNPMARNLEEAYLLAHEHENVELEPIFKFLSECLFDERETMRFLKEINDHVEKIQVFPKAFGNAAERARVRSSLSSD